MIGLSNVTTTEVRTELGENTNVVSSLCKSPKINKWSFWKPTFSSVDTLTEDAIAKANASLIIKTVDLSNVPTSSGSTKTGVPTGDEWGYQRPTKYRLGDFRGYHHDSTPCDAGYYERLTSLQNYNTDVGSNANFPILNSASYNWYPKEQSLAATACSAGLVQCFSFRFSPSSQDVVGGAVGNCIPFNRLFDTSSNTDIYRIGLLIEVSSRWYMIVSAYGLGKQRAGYGGDMIPTLGTNTYLAEQLISQSGTGKTYRAFPCIVKNATLSFSTTNGTKFTSYVNTWSTVYSMPSGQGVFNIKFTTSSPSTSEDSSLKANMPNGYNWLCNLAARQSLAITMIASGQQYSVYSIYYFQNSALTSDKSFTIVKTKKTGGAETKTTTIKAGSTIVVGGTTYYGGLVEGGIQQPTFSNTYSGMTVNGVAVSI